MTVRIIFEDEAAYDHAISEAKAEALDQAAAAWRAMQRTDDHLLAQWLRARAAEIREAGVAPQGFGENATVAATPKAGKALTDLLTPIIARVTDSGQVGTHGPDCHLWHVECLALTVQRIIGAPRDGGGVP